MKPSFAVPKPSNLLVDNNDAWAATLFYNIFLFTQTDIYKNPTERSRWAWLSGGVGGLG